MKRWPDVAIVCVVFVVVFNKKREFSSFLFLCVCVIMMYSHSSIMTLFYYYSLSCHVQNTSVYRETHKWCRFRYFYVCSQAIPGFLVSLSFVHFLSSLPIPGKVILPCVSHFGLNTHTQRAPPPPRIRRKRPPLHHDGPELDLDVSGGGGALSSSPSRRIGGGVGAPAAGAPTARAPLWPAFPPLCERHRIGETRGLTFAACARTRAWWRDRGPSSPAQTLGTLSPSPRRRPPRLRRAQRLWETTRRAAGCSSRPPWGLHRPRPQPPPRRLRTASTRPSARSTGHPRSSSRRPRRARTPV